MKGGRGTVVWKEGKAKQVINIKFGNPVVFVSLGALWRSCLLNKSWL